ncbi:hypothetical protein ACNQP7_31835 [Mycolicibacterium fortuitum]|uniref:hypothetical protein n=1 Tax=Mycolicibacterium fortuitum TaxID=1766 RepID=UPI003AB0AB07
MSGVAVVFKQGPKTYTPADNTVVKGGDVVAAGTGGRCVVAGAAAVNVLGIALNDAIAPEDVVTAASGTPPTLAAVPQVTKVAVAYGGQEVDGVTFTADAAEGVALVAAANGDVSPAGATPDARTIIGWCAEPGGVVVATKATGRVRTR